MLVKHDRIEIDGEPQITMRVIWSNAAARQAAMVQDGSKHCESDWPQLYTYEEIQECLQSGEWRLLEAQVPVRPDFRDLPEEHLTLQECHWSVVEDLVTRHAPAIFIKRERVRLINIAAAAHDLTTHYVKKLLLRCFHRGMDEAAMIPDWSRCGAPGIARLAAEGGTKTGRKRTYGDKPGIGVTSEIRGFFLNAYEAYKRNGRMDLVQAYILCLRMHFSEIVDDLEVGCTKRLPLAKYAEAGLPTFEQFSYHVHKDLKKLQAEALRLGRKYVMRNRALLGNSTFEAWGPCARYQIDATVLDAYVRSSHNRARLIHRPTLYVIIDVFSRVIVGFFISLEPPSWSTAMMALATVVEDKVSLCAKFGITIKPEDWPCRAICSILEGDKGELISSSADHAAKRFGIVIENAASYRADWKGIVESRFRILQHGFKPLIDGYVEKDFRERGSKDYRQAARLTIEELTRIVIHLILYHNNQHQLAGYPRHPGMSEDRVPSVPREIYNWGIANLAGTPRIPQEDLFRFALMPRGQAAVTRQGLKFRGYHYTCVKALEERWFEKASKGRFSVQISYHPRDPSQILLHLPEGEGWYQVCSLTDMDAERYSGMSHQEVELLRESDKQLAAEWREQDLLGRAHADDKIEQENRQARSEFDALPATEDGAKRSMSGVQEAGAEERERAIHGLTTDFASKFGAPEGGAKPEETTHEPTNNVVSLDSVRPPGAYRRPSMAERRKKKD
jgi:hypothetical protein